MSPVKQAHECKMIKEIETNTSWRKAILGGVSVMLIFVGWGFNSSMEAKTEASESKRDISEIKVHMEYMRRDIETIAQAIDAKK